MTDAPALRSVQAHRQVITDLIAPTPVIDVDLAGAAGLALAEPVDAPSSLPRFDNSAVDGFAVHVTDLASASSANPIHLPVAHHIPAGHPVSIALRPGAAAAIMTGAPIPAGASAVVPVEDTRRVGNQVVFAHPPGRGTHIRPTGEDVAAGHRLLERGTVLTAPRIGLLAALGLRRVRVQRRVRVAVVSTGSELVDGSQPLRSGQIHESNAAMLTAAIRGCGAELTSSVLVPDSIPNLRATIMDACADADVVITSGGVSAGDHEVVRQTLGASEAAFVSVAMSPGRPQGAGRVADAALLAFPGNPLAAFVSFELLARPRLRQVMGLPHEERPVVPAPLAHAVSSQPGRRTVHLARRGADGALTVMTGTRRHGLGGAAEADCLLEIDEAVGHLPKSTVVSAVVL